MGIKQIKIGTKDFIGVYINGVKRDFFVGVSKVAEGEPVTPVVPTSGIKVTDDGKGIIFPAGYVLKSESYTDTGIVYEDVALAQEVTVPVLFDPNQITWGQGSTGDTLYNPQINMDGQLSTGGWCSISSNGLISKGEFVDILPTVTAEIPYYDSAHSTCPITTPTASSALATAITNSFTSPSSLVLNGTNKGYGVKLEWTGLTPGEVYMCALPMVCSSVGSTSTKWWWLYDEDGNVVAGPDQFFGQNYTKYTIKSFTVTPDENGNCVRYLVIGSVKDTSTTRTITFGKYSNYDGTEYNKPSRVQKAESHFGEDLVLSCRGDFSEGIPRMLSLSYTPKLTENGDYGNMIAGAHEPLVCYISISKDGKITVKQDIKDASELWKDYYIFDKENNTLQILQNGYYGSSTFIVEDAPRTIEAYIPAAFKAVLDSLVTDSNAVYGTSAYLCRSDQLLALGYSSNMALLMITYATTTALKEQLGITDFWSIGRGSCVDTTAAEVTYNIDGFFSAPHEV